jgi:hypothetical protein
MPAPADQWSDLVAAIVADSDAVLFVSTALQVNRKMFAHTADGRLILKLPAKRVAELVAAGVGASYDAGTGKPLKEWISLQASDGDRWLPLAREAMAFIASKR